MGLKTSHWNMKFTDLLITFYLLLITTYYLLLLLILLFNNLLLVINLHVIKSWFNFYMKSFVFRDILSVPYYVHLFYYLERNWNISMKNISSICIYSTVFINILPNNLSLLFLFEIFEWIILLHFETFCCNLLLAVRIICVKFMQK